MDDFSVNVFCIILLLLGGMANPILFISMFVSLIFVIICLSFTILDFNGDISNIQKLMDNEDMSRMANKLLMTGGCLFVVTTIFAYNLILEFVK